MTPDEQAKHVLQLAESYAQDANALRRAVAFARLQSTVKGMAEQLKAQQAAYARVVAQNQQDREA